MGPTIEIMPNVWNTIDNERARTCNVSIHLKPRSKSEKSVEGNVTSLNLQITTE
jgi:hypothetical protein